MKFSYTLFGILLISLFTCENGASAQSQVNAQDQPATVPIKHYPKAREQANQLSEAMLSGNYERAADLTYPKLVELIGGRTKYVGVLETQFKDMEAQNFRLISNVAADPQDVIEVEKVIYAIVPTTMKIRVREGILVGESYLIGVSNDGGEHWTFLSSRSNSREKLKILFPAAADKLRLPEEKRPVLQRVP